MSRGSAAPEAASLATNLTQSGRCHLPGCCQSKICWPELGALRGGKENPAKFTYGIC
jgi:hypothetical protein